MGDEEETEGWLDAEGVKDIQHVSSDFTYAIIRHSAVLAAASRLCPTYQFCYMVDIGFSLLVDKKGNEKAHTGWVPEFNRH